MDSKSLHITFESMDFEDSKKYACSLRDYLAEQATAYGIELPTRPETANLRSLSLTVYVGAHGKAVQIWLNDWLTTNPAAMIDVTDSDLRTVERVLPAETKGVQTPIRLPDVEFRTELFQTNSNKKKW